MANSTDATSALRARHPMRGRMSEGDFGDETVTFKMDGDFYLASGEFVIVPAEQFAALTSDTPPVERGEEAADVASQMLEWLEAGELPSLDLIEDWASRLAAHTGNGGGA